MLYMLQTILSDPNAAAQFSQDQLIAAQLLAQNLQEHDQQHGQFLGEKPQAQGQGTNSVTTGDMLAETMGGQG